jgi:hypothetical protein
MLRAMCPIRHTSAQEKKLPSELEVWVLYLPAQVVHKKTIAYCCEVLACEDGGATPPPTRFRLNLKSFEDRRDRFATTDAESCQAVAPAGLLESVDQSGDQTPAAGTDRVADRDGTTVDVDLTAVEL